MANRRFRNKKPPLQDNYNPPFDEAVLSEPLSVLKLREETADLLVNAGVTTLRDVVKREEKDFYKIHTFNKKNLIDVKNALRPKKLFLKPPVEKKTESEEKNVGNNAKNIDKNTDKKPVNNRDRKNRGIDENFVMTVKVERPPRPKTVAVKEEPDIYVKVNRGGKWGFKDRAGKQKVEPIYDEVFAFKENICCVEKDEAFGFINREGELIVPLIYECATSFSEGFACVYKNNKCGYINAANEIVVEFKFDAGTPVVNGECRVKRDGKWGELHLDRGENGELIVGDIRWIT